MAWNRTREMRGVHVPCSTHRSWATRNSSSASAEFVLLDEGHLQVGLGHGVGHAGRAVLDCVSRKCDRIASSALAERRQAEGFLPDHDREGGVRSLSLFDRARAASFAPLSP